MKAVIYARYSAGPRQTDQSIEGQVRDCTAYAKENGITIIDTYIDRHISGTDFENRVAFNKLIEDADKGQFEAVIVWKIDRFGRNREELALNKIKLRRKGIRLLYAKEVIPDGPEGIILESLMEGLAEYYVADLRQKVNRGMRETALKGNAVGSVTPLGYKIENKKYAINEKESWIVKYVFEQFSSDVTCVDILRDLKKQGVRNRKGGEFSKNAIYTMLRNRKYIGECYYHDIAIPIPAIIDNDLWEKVQMKLPNKTKAPASYKAKQRYMLSGKVYCGLCGSMMVAESGRGKSGRVYGYYKCGTKKKNRNGSMLCNARNFKKEELEDLVIKSTVEDVLNDEIIDFIADQVIEIYNKDNRNVQLEQFESDLAEVKKSLSNIQRAIEMGIFTEETKNRIEELNARKFELEASIAKAKLKRPELTKNHVVYWLNLFKKGDLTDELFKERLMDVFVHSVYVLEKEIVIAYNYTDNDHPEKLDPNIFRCSNLPCKVNDWEPYSNICFIPDRTIFILKITA